MSEHIRKIVIDAYQRVFGDLDPSAVDEHFAINFIHHGPTIADGPDGVKQLIKRLFKHVVVEGDTVVLHSRLRFIDIHRVENDKVAEHWDAMIQWPESRANNHGLF